MASSNPCGRVRDCESSIAETYAIAIWDLGAETPSSWAGNAALHRGDALAGVLPSLRKKAPRPCDGNRKEAAMRSPATTLMLALGSAASPDATAAPLCSAESDPQMPAVVELYTSEGCSSCPRADRWLWTLTGRPGVLALAFHVNYWDHLGWSDRFATAEGTARQRALARAAGQLSIYTPQVRVNGHDTRAGMPLPAPKPSTLRLTVESDGSEAQVRVAPAATGVPARLAGWWVVVEDGHASRVRAGENVGEKLRHDHVVRLYRPVAEWDSASGLRARLTLPAVEAGHPRRIVFVVADPATHQSLQAVALGC